MLKVEGIHSYYGASHILHGVSLDVGEGEVVSLLGRNGAGKTTTLRSIIGLTPPKQGSILLKGEETSGQKPHAMARRGVSYMPETRGIFPSLSVYENLTLAEGRRPGPWTIPRVFEIFPRLEARRSNGGAQLSGGEQQMLAIARALLLNPDLLLLDEPTEGLAPIIVQDIEERLEAIKHEGMTILLVEQNFRFATNLADRVYVLGKGAIQWSGSTAEILADQAVQKTWLGV
ncbi:ABC transporter ATP-binding protein [Pelagibius sp. Alg239-R121]|uniref:ABC transporter ATP-binding protein n=1 Tax=Pelagibius sp. Alg239-R121 TaxID=2993448 RepID=UPI0024A6BDC1|nr:ABC transporter ATP-binding protein [Pelagibius sp. Alg239-R121]